MFCAGTVLAAGLAAQPCSSPTPVPNGAYTSGDHSQVDNNALSAGNFVLSGSATATFAAGNCIQLLPGFHATAGSAATFHAWVDTAPSAVTFSPSGQTGLSLPFTWTVSSPSGHSSLAHVFALFNNISASTVNACYIHYDPVSNLVYLADNPSATWLGGFVPGSGGSAGNSQCTIVGDRGQPVPSGNQLTISLTVTFVPASFSGMKNEYLFALDNNGVYTGWQPMGTWIVPATPPTITTSSLASATVGTSYSQTLAASGGATPYTWSLIAGSLPPGLTLNSGSGVLSGTPTTVGTSSLTIQVTGSNGATSSRQFSITVAAAPDFTVTAQMISPMPAGTVAPGATAAWLIAVTPLNGFNRDVTVSVVPYSWQTVPASCAWNNVPAVDCNYHPAIGIAGGSGTLTLAVNVYTYPLSNSYGLPVTVRSNDGLFVHTTDPSPNLVIVRTGDPPPPVGITVTPGSTTLDTGATQQFKAYITGSGNNAVTWSLDSPTGAIDSNGVYTAPSSISSTDTVTVTAQSQRDTSQTARAIIKLRYYRLLDPGTAVVTPGSSATMVLWVAPFNGFNSPVTLTCSACSPPSSGLTAALSNPVYTGNPDYRPGYLAISASLASPPGNYVLSLLDSRGSTIDLPLTVTAPSSGLSPHSAYEINMGAMSYFATLTAGYQNYETFYDDNHSLANPPGVPAGFPVLMANCRYPSRERTCYREILAKYRSQGVTGVRFQIFDSHEALGWDMKQGNTSGSDAWTAGITAFFQDLHDAQIYNITPTMYNTPAIGNDINNLNVKNYPDTYTPEDPYRYTVRTNVQPRIGAVPGGGSCPTDTIPMMRWSPTSPFGERCLRTSDKSDSNQCLTDPANNEWDIDGSGDPKAYDCSPANPNFFGWDKILAFYDRLLTAAQSSGLTVEEFDLQNEIVLWNTPVQARLIVDNTHLDTNGNPINVLDQFRAQMGNRAFDLGRVTYSVQGSNTESGGGTVTAGQDCTSSFGDSARIFDLSVLLSTMRGGPFGPIGPSYGPSGLSCAPAGVPADLLPRLPLADTNTLPNIVDVHFAPCMNIPNSGCDTGRGVYDQSAEATVSFNDFSTLRTSYGQNPLPVMVFDHLKTRPYSENLNNALIMLGETFGHNANQPGCPTGSWEIQTGIPGLIAGFNASSLANSMLPNGFPAFTVFRPWEYLENLPDTSKSESSTTVVICNPIRMNPPYSAAH
ncbi:MAG TPA: putative Ig domain-containing protein [Candidatus Acidoferrales bacterium]|nr:putative Ig domain-containing protein [Candidatus Acidoferrales bacterium]